MDKQEKIVCAAIKKWVGDEVEIDLFVNYPEKYKKQKAQINWIGYEKGFITSKNRFVDAQTAKRIAIDAKQVPYPFDHYIGGYVEPLKPEDLY